MSTISAGTTLTTALVNTGDTTGNLVLQTNGTTTALTLDTSQNATLVGSLNAPNTFGFKNRLINGSMAVDQRNAGAAQTITAAAALAYTVDRWYAWTTGANGTTQQVAGTAPSQYALKFTGATSNTLCGIAQRIEQLNCYDLASTAVTISAYMTASTNTTITAILNGPSATANTFGTIASPTVTQIATTTFSVTTTRTLFTWTIPAATMSGFNKGLELIFKAASGLGNGVTWTIESVQLEAGSAATSFDYRPYGTELALCQRYFQKNICNTGGNNSVPISGTGVAYSTTAAYLPVIFLQTMRATPTLDRSGCRLYEPISGGGNVSAMALLGASNISTLLDTTASSLTSGRAYWVAPVTASTDYVSFSAEL